jgi:hypothetical protein
LSKIKVCKKYLFRIKDENREGGGKTQLASWN